MYSQEFMKFLINYNASAVEEDQHEPKKELTCENNINFRFAKLATVPIEVPELG